MSALHTLSAPAELGVDIRKSRFLVRASPAGSAADAMAFLSAAGDALATHNCWAYRVGQHYRFNDDGEPGGTAGRPILQAIDGQKLDRVAVLVTRWYGGIKLGAGGLARAYGGSAAECLRVAPREPIVERTTVRVDCDFAAVAVVQNRCRDLDVDVLDVQFNAGGARLLLRVATTAVDALRDLVRDLTRGRGLVEVIPVDDA